MTFDTSVPLRPGVNVITLVARENVDTVGRRTLIIRRDGTNGELLQTLKTEDESEIAGGPRRLTPSGGKRAAAHAVAHQHRSCSDIRNARGREYPDPIPRRHASVWTRARTASRRTFAKTAGTSRTRTSARLTREQRGKVPLHLWRWI